MKTGVSEKRRANEWSSDSSGLRLECLPAGACYVCAGPMERSSGGKWLCRACGFLLTCCDP
jgi:hypothetical protein